MSVQLSKKQLERLSEGSSDALVVRDSTTNRKYVVVDETAYRRVRPLLDFVSAQFDVSDTGAPPEENGVRWTEADNDRRIALINKKHDRQLTKQEQKELNQLQDRAYQHRDCVAPVRNEVLKLLVEALEQRAKSTK